MRLSQIAVLVSGTLFLTGCSAIPSEADTAACEELRTVLTEKLESLPSGGFDAISLGNRIQSDVVPLAGEGFVDSLNRVSDALKVDPIDGTALTTAGGEIAVRCALVGVNLEFPNPADLLAG